ncbi:hypothetical protein SLEP1_g57794 [Rubroshorea leprosula]|uniref:Uncharacterized protein n=1 Tax=Rubroshorea leprosula TaxID=152421 RepID=A0AAV5MNJ4_9ROSI|nr:hypothetical protein SLEP1_g57794 [Rubroshorea leprosula]
MSSKDTMSVVGSEVMPMEYWSMDTESSPSPSSSKRTVEGVRGDEVVEVGGDSVPITVVEVEGRGEKGYDAGADIVEEVKQPVGVEERACSAPQDHWMLVYAHYLSAGLRFPIPELLVGGSRKDKGWYYFTPRVANRESRALFTAGLSSIKGWKEKFFFVGRGGIPRVESIEAVELYGPSALSEAEMDKFLNTAGGVAIPKKPRKKSKTSTKQVDEIWGLELSPSTQKSWIYSASPSLIRRIFLANSCRQLPLIASISTARELWFPIVLSVSTEIESLVYASEEAKPRTGKSREGVTKVVPTTSAEANEEVPQLKGKGWEERMALQKKKKVVEEEERGSEVPQFVPQPPPVELDPKLRQLEEGAKVRALGKGKGPVPPLAFQSSLFEAKNMMGARRFINTTFPEVDKRNTQDKALRYCGASIVKHVLEYVKLFVFIGVVCLISFFFPSFSLNFCFELQSMSWKEKEELEKKNKELQEALNEVVPTVKQLEQERASLSTKLVFKESKRRISESEREAQVKEIMLMKDAFMELKENVQMLVHNGMKEHINNFIRSNSFDNIVNLYRLPTAIIAFMDCRKKVKAEYPEVDIIKITSGEQEEGVEENGESMLADFRPQIKLRWDHDADGRVVFPPQFDFEFVAVEEKGAEVEEDGVGPRMGGTEVDENQPAPEVEIHPVLSNDEQPPLPDEQQPTEPPLPAEQQPVQPPLPAE